MNTKMIDRIIKAGCLVLVSCYVAVISYLVLALTGVIH